MSSRDFEIAIQEVIDAGKRAAAIQRAYPGGKGVPNADQIQQQVDWFARNSPSMIKSAQAWDTEVASTVDDTISYPSTIDGKTVKVMKPIVLPLPGTSVVNPYSRGQHARWFTNAQGVMQQGSVGLKVSDILVAPFVIQNLPPNVIQTLNVNQDTTDPQHQREFYISKNFDQDFSKLQLVTPKVASTKLSFKFATGDNSRVQFRVPAGNYWLIMKTINAPADQPANIYVSGLASF